MKMIKNIIYLAFIALVFMPFHTAKAQSGSSSLSQLEPVPDFSEELTEEEFKKGSTLFEETPHDDKYLAYEIRLPEGWKKAMTIRLIHRLLKKIWIFYNRNKSK